MLLIDGHLISLWAAAAVGSGVGFVAGMFGVGGGFLLVPLLHVTLGVPLVAAVGVALCQTIATALSSYLRHRKLGNAESRFDIMLIGGSLLGLYIGAELLTLLSTLPPTEIAGREFYPHRLIISGCYIVLFAFMAWLLWTRSGPKGDSPPGPLSRVPLPPYTELPTAGLPRVSGPLIGYIGFGNGVLAGLLGIGGGILLIPIMLYGFGFRIRTVAGTGIIAVLVVALQGTVKFALDGNVHLGLAVTVMIGSALAAQVGAGLTRTLPARTLRRGLAVVLLVTNAALLAKLLAL